MTARETVAIVGANLEGCLAAIYAAKAGYTVLLIETQSRPVMLPHLPLSKIQTIETAHDNAQDTINFKLALPFAVENLELNRMRLGAGLEIELTKLQEEGRLTVLTHTTVKKIEKNPNGSFSLDCIANAENSREFMLNSNQVINTAGTQNKDMKKNIAEPTIPSSKDGYHFIHSENTSAVVSAAMNVVNRLESQSIMKGRRLETERHFPQGSLSPLPPEFRLTGESPTLKLTSRASERAESKRPDNKISPQPF